MQVLIPNRKIVNIHIHVFCLFVGLFVCIIYLISLAFLSTCLFDLLWISSLQNILQRDEKKFCIKIWTSVIQRREKINQLESKNLIVGMTIWHLAFGGRRTTVLLSGLLINSKPHSRFFFCSCMPFLAFLLLSVLSPSNQTWMTWITW